MPIPPICENLCHEVCIPRKYLFHSKCASMSLVLMARSCLMQPYPPTFGSLRRGKARRSAWIARGRCTAAAAGRLRTKKNTWRGMCGRARTPASTIPKRQDFLYAHHARAKVRFLERTRSTGCYVAATKTPAIQRNRVLHVKGLTTLTRESPSECQNPIDQAAFLLPVTFLKFLTFPLEPRR